jgi:hypothetical protein
MPVSPIEEFREFAVSLVGRASDQREASVGASFDDRVASTIELADHGEPAISFENLAQNIFEFNVPISRGEFVTVERVGNELGLAPDSWSFLGPLIR